MAFLDYRWAAGNGVALGSLVNFEDDVKPNNSKIASGKLFPVAVKSSSPNLFPVRDLAMSGVERGDGLVEVIWAVQLATLGYKYILDTYLSSGAAVNAAMTIFTRVRRGNTYTRYDANLILPDPERGEEIELGNDAWQVQLRFTDLVAL